MELDDLQLLRNVAKQEAEIVSIFYEAYIQAGISHSLAEQLTMSRWQQLFNNPAQELQKSIDAMTEAMRKITDPEDD